MVRSSPGGLERYDHAKRSYRPLFRCPNIHPAVISNCAPGHRNCLLGRPSGRDGNAAGEWPVIGLAATAMGECRGSRRRGHPAAGAVQGGRRLAAIGCPGNDARSCGPWCVPRWPWDARRPRKRSWPDVAKTVPVGTSRDLCGLGTRLTTRPQHIGVFDMTVPECRRTDRPVAAYSRDAGGSRRCSPPRSRRSFCSGAAGRKSLPRRTKLLEGRLIIWLGSVPLSGKSRPIHVRAVDSESRKRERRVMPCTGRKIA
jgi:hypothetical protein